jgi:dolichol-phosphate mannosyltransferase
LNSRRLSVFRGVFETYELLAYIPIQAKRLGFSVKEVPVTRSYPSTGEIPTKIKGLKIQAQLIRILVRASLGKYGPKFTD